MVTSMIPSVSNVFVNPNLVNFSFIGRTIANRVIFTSSDNFIIVSSDNYIFTGVK